MTAIATQTSKMRGGEFLLSASTAAEIFTPEDFTEEHRAIARTTEEFFRNEVFRMWRRCSTTRW